jgi:hypothetical protein
MALTMDVLLGCTRRNSGHGRRLAHVFRLNEDGKTDQYALCGLLLEGHALAWVADESEATCPHCLRIRREWVSDDPWWRQPFRPSESDVRRRQ